MATKRPYLLHDEAELYAMLCTLSLQDRKTLASSELKDVRKLFVSISKNTKFELSIPNYNENKKKLSSFFSKLSKQTEATIFMKAFVDVTTANTDGIITLSTSVTPEQIRNLYDKKNDYVLNYMYTYLFFLLGDDFYELLDTHQTGGQHLVRLFHPLTDVQRVRFINYLQTHYANNEILLHLAAEVQGRSPFFDWHYFQTMYRQILEAIDAVGIDPTLIRELIRHTDRNQLDPVGWAAAPAIQQQPQQYYQPPPPHSLPMPQHPSNFLPMLAVAQQIPVSQQQPQHQKQQRPPSNNKIIRNLYKAGRPGDIVSRLLHRDYEIAFRSVETVLMKRYDRLKNDPDIDHAAEYERMQNFLFDLAMANVRNNRDIDASNEFLKNRAAMIARANRIAYEMNRSYLQYATNTAVKMVPAVLGVTTSTLLTVTAARYTYSKVMNPSLLVRIGRALNLTTEEEEAAAIVDLGIKCVAALAAGGAIYGKATSVLGRSIAEHEQEFARITSINYEYQRMIAERNWGIVQNGLKLGANAFLLYAGGHAAGGVAMGMSALQKAGLDRLTEFGSDGKRKTFSYPSSSSAAASSSAAVSSSAASSSAASSSDATLDEEFERQIAQPGAASSSAEHGKAVASSSGHGIMSRNNRSKFASKSRPKKSRSNSSTSAAASVSNSAPVPHPAPVLAQHYVENPPPVLAQQYVEPARILNQGRVSHHGRVHQPEAVPANQVKYDPDMPHLEPETNSNSNSPMVQPPPSQWQHSQRNVIYTANNSTNNNDSNNEVGLTYRPMTKEERKSYPNSNSDGGRRRKYLDRKTKHKKRHIKRHTKRHNRK